MTVKGVATFEADVGNAAGDDRDDPSGRDLMEFLRKGLILRGFAPSRVEPHDSYGWYFEVPVEGGVIWCMLQRSDNWLLITRPIVPGIRRLFGNVPESEHQRVCETIDSILRPDPRVKDIRWYTLPEFEGQGDRGR